MNRSRSLVAAVTMSLAAATLLAALSATYTEWAKGPAKFLFTKDEVKAWKSVKSDGEAREFVELFWAKRDPTPGTPANEFKDRFDQLNKLSDEKFPFKKSPGSVTDRGKVFLLLGPPSSISRTGGRAPSSNIQSGPSGITPGSSAEHTSQTPTEIWKYESTRTPKFSKDREVVIIFADQFASGEFKLDRSPRTDVTRLLADAVDSFIVSPGMTKAPVMTAVAAPSAQAPRTVEVAVPAPQVSTSVTLKSEALKTAVEGFKTGKGSEAYKDTHFTYGEFVTPKGEYYVPIQLFFGKGSGVAAGKDSTFFGVVEDESGKVVAVYEEPAKLGTSRDDLYFDKSLTLPSGKYRAVFGLAAEGKPVTMVSGNLDLKGIDKDAIGVSRLILSNNIEPLKEAQLPTDPYAFGGIKVVPKGDRIFTPADELWYFIELQNPGIDANGAPKVQIKLDLEGMVNKKKVARTVSPRDAALEPLKGVAGHFAIGESIPLATLAPGDYTLKVKLMDTINKQNYTLDEKFRIVEKK